MIASVFGHRYHSMLIYVSTNLQKADDPYFAKAADLYRLKVIPCNLMVCRPVPVVVGRFYVAETFALTQLNCLGIFAASSPRKSWKHTSGIAAVLFNTCSEVNSMSQSYADSLG